MVFPIRQRHIVAPQGGSTVGQGIWRIAAPAQPQGANWRTTVVLVSSPPKEKASLPRPVIQT